MAMRKAGRDRGWAKEECAAKKTRPTFPPMARTTLTDEQKAMVRALAPKEKDKLLLRLIAKDALLLEQLTFTHLEDGASTDDRAGDFRTIYKNRLGGWTGRISPGELMMQLRYCSGDLSRHVRVTKDKLGEVQLAVEMIHFALDDNTKAMRQRYRNAGRWEKLALWIAKRLKTIIAKADKLHPDLWLDFEGQLNEVLLMVHDTPELNRAAEAQGVPRQWVRPS